MPISKLMHIDGYVLNSISCQFLLKQSIYLSVIDFLTHKNCVWICGCVDFAGNPGLLIQQAGPASRPQPVPQANIGIIVGAIIGGILAFAIIAFVIMRYGRLPIFGISKNVDLEGE